jgi:hypothetical protein
LATPTTSKPALDPKIAQNRHSTKQQSTQFSTNQTAPKEKLQQQIIQTLPTKLTHKQKNTKPTQERTPETKQAHLTRKQPNQKLMQPNNFTPNNPQLQKTMHTPLKNSQPKFLGRKIFSGLFAQKQQSLPITT